MAKGRAKRKLSAILCADVVGYSRLMGEDEAATFQALKSCETEIIEPTVEEHNGRIFKRMGDGFLVEFSSAVDSVDCALAWQNLVEDKNFPLKFRIGINLGDVITEGDDVYGDGVNIAARVEMLADSGGICISRDVFNQIRKKVSLGFEYLGEQQVKNISEPIGVYKVLTDPEVAGKVIGEEKQVVGKQSNQRRRNFALAAGILAFIVIALFVGKFNYEPQTESVASEENMAYALPEEPSIAVMPFRAIGNTEDEELLVDGILTSITTALSKTPKLFTVDYTSTAKYKGEEAPVKDIAEGLSVRYVLMGDLQKSGDQVRVNVKLIDALNGENVWADKYDRSSDDLFAMQDDITREVIKALQVELYEGEYGNVLARETDNLEAYLKVVQGYQHFQIGNKDGDIMARRLAEEAIELDPNYAAAYSLLARPLWRSLIFGYAEDPVKTKQHALDAALKAVELDYSADTLSLLGVLYSQMMKEWEKGLEVTEKALALNPHNSRALNNLSMVKKFAGQCEEAIPLNDKALRISPRHSANILFSGATAYLTCHQYDECISLAQRALDISPNSFLAHRTLAMCYAASGQMEKAKASVVELLKINPNFTVKKHPSVWRDNKVNEWQRNLLRIAGVPEE